MRRIKIAALLVVASLTVLLVEGIALLAGATRWPSDDRIVGHSVRNHDPDPVIGWRKIAGRFNYERLGRRIRVTHWKNNLRASAAKRVSRSRLVVLLGGSFTYGFGLNDDETFAWRLQTSYPEVEWQNYGTIAYGTYQSLLVLERYFATEKTVPTLVIYGFNQFHDERNVAPPSWQYWKALASPNERIRLPYVSLNQDGSLRRQSHTYPDWPLKRYSAAITLMERGYNKLQATGRAYQQRSVMRQLMVEMDELTREKGSRLLVMVMGRCDDYGFFSQEGILAANCEPRTRPPALYLSDGHPSARLNVDYAECLESFLETKRLMEFP